MKVADYATREDAKAAFLVNRKVFNSNEMTMYLLRCELLDHVLDAPSGILRAFGIRLLVDSRFDFRDNTGDGMANDYSLGLLIDGAADDGLKSKFTYLRKLLVEAANVKSYPFSEITPEEFDKAKADALLYGEQDATSVHYMGGGDKHVKLANEAVRLTVLLEEPVAVDTTVTFGLLIRNHEDQEFSPVQSWSFSLVIPAGKVIASDDITNSSKLTRHTQFTAKANVINDFTVEITSS